MGIVSANGVSMYIVESYRGLACIQALIWDGCVAAGSIIILFSPVDGGNLEIPESGIDLLRMTSYSDLKSLSFIGEIRSLYAFDETFNRGFEFLSNLFPCNSILVSVDRFPVPPYSLSRDIARTLVFFTSTWLATAKRYLINMLVGSDISDSIYLTFSQLSRVDLVSFETGGKGYRIKHHRPYQKLSLFVENNISNLYVGCRIIILLPLLRTRSRQMFWDKCVDFLVGLAENGFHSIGIKLHPRSGAPELGLLEDVLVRFPLVSIIDAKKPIELYDLSEVIVLAHHTSAKLPEAFAFIRDWDAEYETFRSVDSNGRFFEQLSFFQLRIWILSQEVCGE